MFNRRCHHRVRNCLIMRKLKAVVLYIAAMSTVGSVSAGKVEFKSTGLPVIEADAPASSGLSKIYVASSMSGIAIEYTADNPGEAVTWQRFSSLGGGYAEPITGIVRDGDKWVLGSVEGDMGYIITEGTTMTCIWVVDYSCHRLLLRSLEPAPEQDCAMASLLLDGNASKITYYDINGRALTLSRDLKVSYSTLEYDDESGNYHVVPVEDSLEEVSSTLHVASPLCATAITLEGDRFLKIWGEEESVTSPEMQPYAVEGHTNAERQGEVAENEVKDGDATSLGGSAPAIIDFSAQVTDGVVFTEWQMSSTSDFEEIMYRDNQLSFTYTFDELGTMYVRFVCDNAAGTCQWTGQTYEVAIGESSLLCPNAFSPGASEGVNDEWRVSYKSIVEFECYIFNRWGQKMASLTSPSQGWDGRHGGKLVPAGVYYYVIKARGADGKKYDLSGDINIVNYK